MRESSSRKIARAVPLVRMSATAIWANVAVDKPQRDFGNVLEIRVVDTKWSSWRE